MAIDYPVAQRVEQTDAYHGTVVADPYRWLEAANSAETQAWIEAQNQITTTFLSDVTVHSTLQQRLRTLWNYERYSTPFRRRLANDTTRYFYFKNDGLQNQSVLYVQDTLAGESRVLLDPNQLSDDGTIALSGLAVSEDGQLLAYALSKSGSDWKEWYVRHVETGEDLADHLQWSKFSGAAWTHDGAGFFYSRFDEPQTEQQFAETNYFQKLYYHRLGTPQAEDQLIYHRPDQKEWGFYGSVTDDGRYLFIQVSLGTDSRNLLFYKDLAEPDADVIELVTEFEAGFQVVGNQGTKVWLWTDLEAPKGRIVSLDLQQPDRQHWQTVIPEGKDTLESASLLNQQLVATYLKDAYSQIRVFNLEGQPQFEITLPGIGSVGGFGGRPDDTETFYSFTGFTTATTIYRYDFATRESTCFRAPAIDFDTSLYETKQVFCQSKDGTTVPIFLTYKRGLELNGQNPTYLYGYGGFNISITPSFSVSILPWLELGGVYAVANLRGGGEYGETWHQAGMKTNKQNVFDDFIAAAEWLIEQRYTCSAKLAIAGGSNGGLLVGACMTQRPDLFGAALPAVGVMDMLRFHQFTIGWAWCSEYGSPDNAEDFDALYQYSPLHNLNPGTEYPATLITTADHDDRVVPAHSFKFAAALQAAHQGDNPVLIRIETKAGHGAGKPIAKVIEEVSDKWAFLYKVLDLQL
ncbi:MAG: prolyl oligopeptidase family serine peptidase [Cyanobacteria bacterium P01_H01_bin.121]